MKDDILEKCTFELFSLLAKPQKTIDDCMAISQLTQMIAMPAKEIKP
jgi:hypothetical protein